MVVFIKNILLDLMVKAMINGAKASSSSMSSTSKLSKNVVKAFCEPSVVYRNTFSVVILISHSD